jgi:hypothetical protein
VVCVCCVTAIATIIIMHNICCKKFKYVQFVSIVQIDCLPKRPPGQSFAFPEDPYAPTASFQVLVLSTWHSLRDKLFVLVTQVSDVTSVELVVLASS